MLVVFLIGSGLVYLWLASRSELIERMAESRRRFGQSASSAEIRVTLVASAGLVIALGLWMIL